MTNSPKDRATTRGRALGFTVVFLLSTLALLVGYRYAIGTSFMNGYLFQVARHTAWVLGKVGHAATLEPGEYQGREGEIRAELASWRAAGGLLDRSVRNKGSGLPLTAWEKWQYRSGRFHEELRSDIDQLEALRPLPDHLIGDDKEMSAVLAEGIVRFERGLQRSGVSRGTTWNAANGVEEAFLDLKSDFEAVADRVPGNDVVFHEMAARLNELHRQQVVFLEGEIAEKRRRLRDRFGPLILYESRWGSTLRPVTGVQKGRTDSQQDNDAGKGMKDRSFRFSVVPDCGAIPSMAILFSALIAFPAPWWKRAIGVVLGIPLLYAVNTLRLSCLAIIGAWDGGGEWFEFAHHYGWQGVYLIFVVMMWLLWVELLVKRRST